METADYPALHDAADGASLRGQREYLWLTRLEIALMIFAAVVATARTVGGLVGPSATVIAATLVVALVARLVNRVLRPDKRWFDGRAVAESVKSATWRYAMRLEPFDGEVALARAQLAATLEAALRSRPELAPSLSVDAERPLVGHRFDSLRALPESARVDRYVSDRLDDQWHWYDARSRDNRRSAARWFWTGVAAQVSAVVFAMVAITAPPAFGLIGLLSAVGTATTAFAQLGRDDELGRSYGLAAGELAQIRLAITESIGRGDDLISRLRDAEEAISREHTMWVAKRS